MAGLQGSQYGTKAPLEMLPVTGHRPGVLHIQRMDS